MFVAQQIIFIGFYLIFLKQRKITMAKCKEVGCRRY